MAKLGQNNSGENMQRPDHDEFSIRTGEKNVKRISSGNLKELSEPAVQDPVLQSQSGDESVSSSNSTEIFAFDVYEREGFDQIMRTVTGSSSQQQEAFARSVCDYLEIFESLSSGRYVLRRLICHMCLSSSLQLCYSPSSPSIARRLAIWSVASRQ